ncbi:MAG: hypothetical protein UY10_C0010G0007, partial [Microgenomates group bacterium GW2011_GWA2_47_8]
MSPEKREPEKVLSELEHIPVARLRKIIREQIREHPNFVLIGETGSGKTTCLPPLLLELRDELGIIGKIGVTQPRRVATRSVTSRVSDMMGCDVGGSIGYHVRFEDITSDSTDITFMTDGILLRKIQFDPFLSEFSIIMIDEAHERSLNIDLCLGLLIDVNHSRLQTGMEPLRLVITSATIERNKFAEYIGLEDKNNSVEIPGKMFPVKVFYETEIPWRYDYMKSAADKVEFILENDLAGDILIFMPGKKEINTTIENIKAIPGRQKLSILPLHAELSSEEQDRVFLPSKKRKVIVSTNIAETSVTIDGIIHVIDSGLIKQTRFDPKTGIEQLVLVEHALSGLDQRKGRAGRTAPGYCYRLFTEDSLRRRKKYPSPEIERSNLSQVVLAMKKVGIEDIEKFNFIDPPNRGAIHQAIKNLTLLGALDDRGHLTKIGEFMVDLGIDPRLGRMIIEATRPDNHCLSEICTIASFLDGKNIFIRPEEIAQEREANRLHERYKKENNSDFMVIHNVWNAYVKSGYDSDWAKANYLNEKTLEEARKVRLELLDVLKNHHLSVDDNPPQKINQDSLGKAITSGLIT